MPDSNTDITVYDSTGSTAINIGSHVQYSTKDPQTGAVIGTYTGYVQQIFQHHPAKYTRLRITPDVAGPDISRHNTSVLVIA